MTRPISLVILSLALSAALSACGRTERSSPGAQASATADPRVDSAAARALVAAGATLVDVRSPGEFESGHLDGARNVPVNELSARLAEIPRDRPVVVYCRSGARSEAAARVLAEAGYDARDLGAMSNW